MEQFKKRLLERYDIHIAELEQIDLECRNFLNEAT